MIWLVAALTAVSVGLLVLGIANLAPGEGRIVKRRLAALQTDAITYRELQERRRRQAKRQRLEALLEALGEKMGAGEKEQEEGQPSETRKWLVYGGYRHANAVAIFMGVRLLFAAALGLGAFFGLAVFALPTSQIFLLTAVAGLVGWMLPFLVVNSRVKKRQLEIQRALPDTLDLLVVCVEAGLGLNQALVRVAEEIDRISPEMSDELTVVNLEIRAGTPRDEALRHLGDRTGVDDVRALVSMLVQTDRFGTSVADSLRVHAETLRSKRMQRAEEKAAKTTVKMLFPLILFIFPAIFVALLGPAVFIFRDFFGGM